MSSFFSELRRRNIFRVGIAYGIVGWVLTEIASVVFDAFAFPPWAIQLFITFVILGFPLVLVFAWAYELTPEGLKKEKEVDRSRSITAKTGRKLDFLIIGVLAVAVVVLAVTHDWGRDPEHIASIDVARKSIVVLPFVNMSADPEQEYFVGGMHDALIAELARISELSVISRTSANRYSDTDLTIPDIAAELGVANVVEGSVFRAGDQLRIQAQLIDGKTDEHLWAKTYERELSDVLNLHKEVTRDIAREVQVTLTDVERVNLAVKRQVHPDGHRLYLQARQLLDTPNQEPIEKAIELMEEAIRIDPKFAEAHSGRAAAYQALAYFSFVSRKKAIAPASESARRALELDPSLAEPYAILANHARAEKKWDEAGQIFQRAHLLNPNDVQTIVDYAQHLSSLGQYEEAIKLAQRIKELDPFNVIRNVVRGHMYIYSRRYEEALAVFDEILAVRPTATYANWSRGVVYIHQGRFEEALAEFNKCISCPWSIGVANALLGETDKAQAMIDNYLERNKTEYVRASFVAIQYAAIGDNDEAFKWLEKAYDDREMWLDWLRSDPLWDLLRDDPRFDELIARMNFPQPTP